MTTSKRINPYKLFIGSFIPNWLLKRNEISQGAKLCYARLCQYSGEDGECFPKLETLAEEIGVTLNMAHRYCKELSEHRLIEIEQIGLGKPNRYYFLYHEFMDSELSYKAEKKSKEEPSRLSAPELERADEILKLYNKFALNNKLRTSLKLTKERESKLKKCFEDNYFDFKLILDKIKESKFLLGRSSTFKVSFDFIIADENYINILENKYSDSALNREDKVERMNRTISQANNLYEKLSTAIQQ